MSTESGVCHLVMQATPSAKGVACATICYCCQRDSDVCILLYIEERPIFCEHNFSVISTPLGIKC